MYLVWTDSSPERETVYSSDARAAAEGYAKARVEDIDGEVVHVETPGGDVRRYIVRAGRASLAPSE